MPSKKELSKRIKYMEASSDLFAATLSQMSIKDKAKLLRFYSKFSINDLYTVSPKHYNNAVRAYLDLKEYTIKNTTHNLYIGQIIKNVKTTLHDYGQSIFGDAGISDEIGTLDFIIYTSALILGEIVTFPFNIVRQGYQTVKNLFHSPLIGLNNYCKKLEKFALENSFTDEITAIDERNTPSTASRKPADIKKVFREKHRTVTNQQLFGEIKETSNDILSQTFDKNAVSLPHDNYNDLGDFPLPNNDIDDA